MNRPTATLLFSLLLTILALAGPLTAQTIAPESGGPTRAVASPDACGDGFVPDDGTAETGYGWVPSVVDGIYVQQVTTADLPAAELRSVCVCWLRTRPDDEIDFEVVFFAEGGGQPQGGPYASVPARATGVPVGVTGRFYEVDVSGVFLRPGITYVGVRWNPSVDQFFFVCTDTSPATDPVEAFFIDDRARGWTSVFEALDPIFAPHRAILVRLRSRAPSVLDVPALPGSGLVLFGIGLAAAGLAAVRGSRRRVRSTTSREERRPGGGRGKRR